MRQEIKSARSAQARFIGLILLLILALGAALRLVNLGSDSIWLDEAYSIQFARLPLPQLLAETASSDVHPPLYYLLLHFWIKLCGDSEAGARLLSALFGLLAILMIYFVAALLFDRATGLLSALLLSLSLFHIEFAQEARMYSLLAFLSLCSLYFFLKLFDETKRRRALHIIGYLLTTSLLMHTHVYGFFIIIAENLFFFALCFSRREFKRDAARWLLLQAALVALFLPWLFVMLRQFARVQQGFWIPQPTLNFLRLTWMLYSGSTLLSFLFIPLVALGLFAARETSNGHSAEERANHLAAAARRLPLSEREKLLLMLLWLLSPILIPFVLSQKLASIYLPKYTIAASTAFLVLAARGIMSLRFDRARVVLVAVVLGLSFAQMRDYWSAAHKDFWRESASYFEHTARAGDLTLFHQGNGHVPFDYYSKRNDIKQVPLDDTWQLTTVSVASMLQPLVAGHNRVWLVASHQNEATELIRKQLGEWYKVTEHRVDPGVELYLFEKGTTPQ
ncbi:MAG TPA: glycosyltransferase family 39 protein [Pyrinomonadaceae bacterium]